MARLRNLIEELKILESFNDLYSPGKWHDMSVADLKKDPKLAKEFFDLIAKAYSKIGGHLKLKSPASLLGGEVNLFQAIDIDNDGEVDALKVYKKKSAGMKSVGMGHDGSAAGKQAAIAKSAKSLKSTGFYAEMSDAIAHIMITRHGVKSVNSHKRVEKVLGKKVEWVGAHPDGKYPDHAGWYYRAIGGKKKLKILLGKPS